ncbi:hypothetical protein Dsin_019326 [Dipteronia sinensis]|uniref:C3H1-type domain-containing protein n=1 Tax=Dipteronia sinensis TaxID=43782 RepID=A0AAE0A7B4_9ROSI|nr:hypothetical protein Dsin_019326 [Dipteronia sinensis]
MCGGSEKLNSKTLAPASAQSELSMSRTMGNLAETVNAEHSFSRLLELAADNDAEGFKEAVGDGSAIDEIGLWYSFHGVLKKMVLECRTPLMVAATYGSVDVVKLILSFSKADVNLSCGLDKSTALHCASSSGSINVVDVVKLLILAGADSNATDANGHRPFDLIFAHRNICDSRVNLEELLKNSGCKDDLRVSTVSLRFSSPSLSSSSDNGSCVSDLPLSYVTCKTDDIHPSFAAEKKEYPIDPSLPDIKNGIYSSDEFRMFSFKIRPCSRAYSHDWTECPFAHPGENARRRDPRKFHYSCVPCPDFRKGSCERGDLCEYAHGVFESWLHPAQYRTRLCKDGTSCMRRVCFFAHKSEELRPLYASTGSGVPSPRSAMAMDMALALNMLPGSPSAVSAMSPSPFTAPMSPSNDISHSSMGWPQQSIPTLHLPGSNFQTSRLRSSLNARDIPAEQLDMLQDFEMHQHQLLNDLSPLSHPQFSPSLPKSNSLTPTNLDKLFYAEVSSPRYSDQFTAASVLSPSHKTVVFNQLQQQQIMLSPIKTNMLSPKNVDHPLLQGSFGVSSPGRMSPRMVEPISPMGSRLSVRAHREKLQQHLSNFSLQELGSNLSHDPKSNSAVGSPVNSRSKWESFNAKVDWSVQNDDFNRLGKSYSFGRKREEPDVSWVQSNFKETPSWKVKETPTVPPASMAQSVEGSNLNPQSESGDHLGAWLDQLKLDQIVA